ncbi:MAG: hypothetical protein HY827_03075 [Actinobacteria bacterium]|nr:hypothetical protein [Actinomycetota bacterium]
MLCPNCMSPYVKPFEPEDDDASAPEEPLMECTECEWVGPLAEFVPENMR